jgi:alkylation response protein AidB-like acyl-CoA dehydrogenase
MRFDLSDEQEAIKAAAKDFLGARYPLSKVRELAETGNYDGAIWSEIGKLGWPGLAISEEHGGQGLGLVELAVLLEEIGYVVAPSPFFSSVAAALLLERCGSEEQKKRWLPEVATGEKTITLGVTGPDGTALVPDADLAAAIVLVSGRRASIVEGPADASRRVETMDMTRHFFRLDAAAGEPLGLDPGPGMDLVEIALSAEVVGVAQRALDMSVEYAKVRTQFGRPIGAYQAVSHRCAEMLLQTESARSATLYAAWTAGNEPDSVPLAASVAKVMAGQAGWAVTASALQVHGGIGFTWEHDLHFLLKRAQVDEHLFGSVATHRDRVADLSGLPSLVAQGV